MRPGGRATGGVVVSFADVAGAVRVLPGFLVQAVALL
jgi:hypothetical protein